MNEILFLQYPKCSTCKKAAKWLENNNLKVVNRNITEDNPTRKELAEWTILSKLPIRSFFNTSGQLYREMNLKEKVNTASDSELIEILSTNGMLVKRPLIVTDQFVLVGFNEDKWNELLK